MKNNTTILREKAVSSDEFDRIAKKFPNTPVRSFQASGSEELFLIKWESGKKAPYDLIHLFPAIFG